MGHEPLITCIVCAFHEGEAIRLSLESLLAQTFRDFEILVVDDGADPETRAALDSYRDARIRRIAQTNDGLSSARNRALHHVRGRYVTFLDGDDSRPAWSLAKLAACIADGAPEVVFTRGLLSELRGELKPFYDDPLFDKITLKLLGRGRLSSRDAVFRDVLPLMLALEPQSANKCVSSALLREKRIKFPSSHFFEDILFHASVVAAASSFAFVDTPCFTYYRRYGHAQITSGTGDVRFDAVAVGAVTLELFARSPRFHNPAARAALTVAVFRLIAWCEDSIGHSFRFQFHQLVLLTMRAVDPRYFAGLDGFRRQAPDVGPVIDYIQRARVEAHI